MSYLALKFGQNPENYKNIENAQEEYEPVLQLALHKVWWRLRPLSHLTFMPKEKSVSIFESRANHCPNFDKTATNCILLQDRRDMTPIY